jgi:two-component system cell cycle sensor histidine kinase/response regulator CckA
MVSQSIDVLLVEDNPGDARLLQEILRDVPSTRYRLMQVEQLGQALQCLAAGSFDVILLDLSLPDSQGLETFVRLYPQAIAIPIVVLTGLDDETLAIRAMQAGAQDYLVKGQVSGDLLGRSIRYAIERKWAEQKIREQAALLDVVTDAILLQDGSHQILFWNKGAERLYGWKGDEALGKNAKTLLSIEADSQLEEALKAVAMQGVWHGELRKVTKEGREIVVASRWTLVRDEQERPKSILTVDTDVTEKKQLEAQFFRAQRLESLGTLASGIAHDLNNILTPILGIAQLLPMKIPQLDERTQRLLEILEGNSRRATDLVKQILSFARGAEGKRKILQVRHPLLEVVQIAKKTFPKSIEIHIDISTQDLWTVFADFTQLHQVFMNLLVNARDAMPDGGILSLSAQNRFVDETYARFHLDARKGPYVVISVSDTGIGIPAELMERIFEPFFTTKEVGKGTGLGLSTVIGIVKSHGGFVTVYSEVGKGSQFKVYLPTLEAKEPLPGKDDLELPQGKGESIFVVDDEATIREITKTTLESYDYKVLTASDGFEAIALYARYKDEVRVVLMDVMMPTMDGVTAIRTLQKINPQVKIIATSGLESNSKLAEMSGTNVIFLPKPYTVQELLQTIQNILGLP